MQKENNIIDLAIVIPIYNEEDCIKKVLDDLNKEISKLNINYRFILVNDGSKDNSKKIIEEWLIENPNHLFIDQQNSGHGKSILNGYSKAIEINCEWVFQIDSDGQFDPADFKVLWDKRSSCEFVIGYREVRNDPLGRKIISYIMKMIVLLMYMEEPSDANCPFRLIKTSHLKWMISKISMDSFAPNIFLSVLSSKFANGYEEVPVSHFDRQTGEVSIVRLSLLKACMKSFLDLFLFSIRFHFLKRE